MLTKQVASRQRLNVVLFYEAGRKCALACPRLPEDDEAEDISLVAFRVYSSPERIEKKGEGSAGRGRVGD